MVVQHSPNFLYLRCHEARLDFISNSGWCSIVSRGHTSGRSYRFRQQWHVWRQVSPVGSLKLVAGIFLLILESFAPAVNILLSCAAIDAKQRFVGGFAWRSAKAPVSDLGVGSISMDRYVHPVTAEFQRELEIFHRCRAISPLDCFVINVYARRITLSFCFAPCYIVICRGACHHLLNFSTERNRDTWIIIQKHVAFKHLFKSPILQKLRCTVRESTIRIFLQIGRIPVCSSSHRNKQKLCCFVSSNPALFKTETCTICKKIFTDKFVPVRFGSVLFQLDATKSRPPISAVQRLAKTNSREQE